MTVAPERIGVRPGESAEVEVTIQNGTAVVEHFGAAVVGLPRDDFFQCEPAVVKLRPRETGTVKVRITVPERGGMPAGPYTLGVLVRSPYQREVSRCEELPMEVAPAPELTMSVQPEVVLGGRVGHYTVTLGNDGNTPLGITLSGKDQESRVGFEFEPRQLLLEPGMAGGAQVTVRANAPMTGQEVRRALTVKADTGELNVERPATFVQRPRIAGGLMRVAGIATGIAVMAGAAIGGALIIRDNKTANAAQTAPLQPTSNQQQQQQQQQQSGAPSSGGPQPSGASAAPSSPGASQQTVAPSGAADPSAAQGGLFIDFAQSPDGQPVGNRLMSGDQFADKGVTIAADTQLAPDACKTANGLALRTITNFGSFLTSADPATAERCNTNPIRFTFSQPVGEVRVNFTGAHIQDRAAVADPKLGYTLTIQLSDGTVQAAQGTVQTGFITFTAPAGGATVQSVVFSHSNPDPAAKDLTMIKSIAFSPPK
ncbi:hypothetical protein [Labedaea rhizosphaerae]|uniref:COG1470 family protein n=1 Tax=Labedaea rhizosphaerae TaxID=598644 RepID=UPI001414FA2E|nr:hypothetical protein [Labedaea rhizosphaerae]